MNKFSRFSKTEQRENIKKSIVYLAITAGLLIFFLYVGVPLLARLAIFIGGGSSINSNNDSIPPAPPRLAPTNEFTKQETVGIKGFTESGAEVELFLNGASVKKVIADGSGEFNFSDVELAEGSNEIYTISKDANGNSSQPSGILNITVDKTAPEIEISSPSDGQTFLGEENKNIKVAGKIEEDVTLKINGRSVMIGSEGSFETTVSLSDGDQEIKINATDKAGNTTEETINVTYSP